MEYLTFPANPDLATFIKCYWTLNIPKQVAKGPQQVLPDGCMDMIFNLGDDVKRLISEDSYLIQPRSFILGQISKAFWIEPTGRVETFAVRFYPACFSYFSDVSMASLVDKDTELNKLFDPQQVKQLETAISQTSDTNQRIQILDQFLFDLLKEKTNLDELLKSTLEKIYHTKGTLGVHKILQNQQNQRRKLERKFSKHVGLSPKQLCRVIRLQATLKTMLEGEKNLTTIGLENDYFDQAHFIKDFKEFTGLSPKEFYTDQSFTLSSLFYAKD